MYLSACSGKDNQGLLISVTELCSLLEESNCLGKQFRYRSTILKVLFRLLDVDDAELRLKLASMILDVSTCIFYLAFLTFASNFFLLFSWHLRS